MKLKNSVSPGLYQVGPTVPVPDRLVFIWWNYFIQFTIPSSTQSPYTLPPIPPQCLPKNWKNDTSCWGRKTSELAKRDPGWKIYTWIFESMRFKTSAEWIVPLEKEKHLVKFAFFRSHQNHPDNIDFFPKHLHNSQIERSLEAAQASEEISNSNKTWIVSRMQVNFYMLHPIPNLDEIF